MVRSALRRLRGGCAEKAASWTFVTCRPRRGNVGMLGRGGAAVIALLTLAGMPAEAAAEGASEPRVRATLPWVATQLVPSAEWLVSNAGVRFGARWQVTPLLYSFGIDPRLSPWRVLVAEPIVRHAGSVELYGSPAYLAGGGTLGNRWLLRAGVRAYLPILDRGEYLSMSVGGAALYHRDQAGMAYEAGLYTLFGFLGVQVSHVPTPGLRMTTVTLNVRYF